MSEIQDILGDPLLTDAGIAAHRHFEAGNTIVAAGSNDRSLYLIERGTVRVTGHIELDDHRRIQPGLCDLAVGEVFGELSLYGGATRSASVVAVEDCDLKVFDADALENFFEQHPEHGYRALKWLFSVLNQRLRSADRRLERLFAWGLRAHGIDRHL